MIETIQKGPYTLRFDHQHVTQVLIRKRQIRQFGPQPRLVEVK